MSSKVFLINLNRFFFRYILFLLSFFFFIHNSSAQISKAEDAFSPKEMDEFKSIQKKIKQKKKKNTNWILFNKDMDSKIDEYNKLMIKNSKNKRKQRKLLSKPQYSDFTYFKHKRKPKKRPVGKKKYCDFCGIWH